MASALKLALEDLLKTRGLAGVSLPLRGERLWAAVSAGGTALDAILGGGFPRGQVSEVYGPASSGRTAVALAAIIAATRRGRLCAWIDPGDHFDPHSAARAGLDLDRLLWLRGEPHGLQRPLSALGRLLGSGLFEILVLDLAGASQAVLARVPPGTWLRLQRMIEPTPAVLLLLARAPLAHGPRGVSLALHPGASRWSAGRAGRLLRSLTIEAAPAGWHGSRRAALELLSLP